MHNIHLTIVLAPLAAAIVAGLFGKQIGRAGSRNVKDVTFALADSGYMNEAMIKDIEKTSDTIVLASAGKDPPSD